VITIELPGIPRGKGRPRFVRKTGRTYTPAKTASYEAALATAAAAVMGQQPPLQTALLVEILAYMPIPKSWTKGKQAAALMGLCRPMTTPDADNLMKMVDALNGIVWRDDSQIVYAVVSKFYSDRPRLLIQVVEAS
jgi:Holliday junction resolvase RusA-like endonuclease